MNPNSISDLRDVRARGANTGDIRDFNGQKWRWSGTQWSREGGGGSGSNSAGFSGSTDLGQMLREQSAREAAARQERSAEIARQEASRTSLNQRLNTESGDFLTRFKTEYPTILSGIENKLGLPQIRGAAQSVGEDIQSLPQAVQQATIGRDVSASQRGRIESAQRSDLVGKLNPLLSSQQFAESEFSRQADRELTPFKTEIDFMKDKFSRETSGFDIDSENRLNSLLTLIDNEAKTGQATIGAGSALMQSRIQEARQLAELEEQKRQYDSSVSTVDLGNKIQFVGPGGNVIREVAKGAAPTSGAGNIGYITDAPTTTPQSGTQPFSMANPYQTGQSSTTNLDTLWNRYFQ